MATGMRVCKVCGAEYKACTATRLVEGVFRWKDVACCPEHGQEYLKRVMIARGELKENTVAVKPPKAVKDETSKKKAIDEEIIETKFEKPVEEAAEETNE